MGAASKRDRYSNDFAGALDNSKPEVVAALIARGGEQRELRSGSMSAKIIATGTT